MIGRGFSSCLFCESENDLMIGNKLAHKIIHARYETDIFDVMLQNTKICIKCIGRLQQINEFCANNKIIVPKYEDEVENGKNKCDMCQLAYSPYEMLPPNKSIDIDLTKWFKNDEEENKKVISCYSCYNFISLYNEIREQLTQLLDYFYNALNKCKVIIKDCGQTEDQHDNSDNTEQEQFFGSLSLAPVANLNRSHRHRVSFAPEVEVISQSPIKKFRASRGKSSLTSESVELMETASCENIISVQGKVPSKLINRRLRNSIESVPRVVSKKLSKTRRSTGSKTSASNFEVLKRQYNITECIIELKKLAVKPKGSDTKKNVKDSSAKKKPIKIKLNARSKIINRQMNRSLRSEKKSSSNEFEKSLNLEVVITQENLNNSQTSTMSADPLDAPENNINAQNDSSSFSLDDSLPIISAKHSPATVEIQIRDEENNNKISSKENNDIPEARTTRKTRNSAGKLTESTNVPVKESVTKKRKAKTKLTPRKPTKNLKSLISPKQELEEQFEPETNENVNLNEEEAAACEEYLSMPEESEEALEESYLTEIEFLHPQYNNKAVQFESKSNEEEMELLSASQENFMSLSTEDLNMNNAEYLDESLEEIMNTRLSPQNDTLCPIYTMDQLLNEDSLLNLT